MHLIKRTYSIDEATLSAFEREVSSGDRSVLVTNLMREYLQDREKEKIRRALIEGAPAVNDLYQQIAKEWEVTEDLRHGGKAHSSAPKRRHRSRKS